MIPDCTYINLPAGSVFKEDYYELVIKTAESGKAGGWLFNEDDGLQRASNCCCNELAECEHEVTFIPPEFIEYG